MRVVGVLLAAGQGSRFGGGKLLAPLSDGTPVGLQSLRRLRAVLDEVIAVVRPQDHELAASFEGVPGVRVERCPRAHEGMGASLAHAVEASADADGWVVALADMPLIDPSTIARVVDAMLAGAVVAAPAYRGKRGHPVGLSSVLGEQLRGLDGDAGARDILRAEAGRIELIDVDDAGVLADIDTPHQLDEINARTGE